MLWMTLGRRITTARKSRGWSQARLARAVGKSDGTIWSWESGRTEPSRADVERVAAALSVPLSEIENINGSLAISPVLRVPLIAWVSAGAAHDVDAIDSSSGELIGVADLPPGTYFATDVRGDSMDRVSPEGSRIIVNIDDVSLVSGRAYVFSIRGETTYKIFQRDPVLRLEPYSTNPAHRTIFLQSRDWSVIGRVVRSYIDLP